jgi:hypothetical protein
MSHILSYIAIHPEEGQEHITGGTDCREWLKEGLISSSSGVTFAAAYFPSQNVSKIRLQRILDKALLLAQRNLSDKNMVLGLVYMGPRLRAPAQSPAEVVLRLFSCCIYSYSQGTQPHGIRSLCIQELVRISIIHWL